jgi:4-alpha-glucanotransferase
MKSVIFSFATHNHQPFGNFEYVFEEAYANSYLPFFELAAQYPTFRFATHFTGILLEWMEAHHPEHIAKLRRMVHSGQLEMISGGYYEPILSVIPAKDQQAQIAMLSQKIRELFHTEPRGLWLAERVWEQPLASVLHHAALDYVLLDDTHFLSAGLREENLTGYYLTEDLGKTLAIFPISKALRYAIPFMPVDETLRILRDAASERGDNIVTFADDGEKFGVWPGTYNDVYDEGWLEEFFRKLSEHSNWIDIVPPGEVLTRGVGLCGRMYLPTSSYAEMMQWSLPTVDAIRSYEHFIHALDEIRDSPFISGSEAMDRTFVQGGYWRNFFVKYPEANHLHKHNLRTSARIQTLADAGVDVADARRELFRSQCNDPYWHGIFGGIYLSNLRHANYSALVKADAMLDVVEGLSGIRMEASDMDCDGAPEVMLESRIFSLFVKPSLGGMIAEIDFKPRAFNATNVVSRRKEAYHSKVAHAKVVAIKASTDPDHAKSIHSALKAKEPGLEKLLVYDAYRRGCMIEHFFPIINPLSQHGEGTGGEVELGNLVTSAFEWGWNKENGYLSLTCLGSVLGKSIRMTKELSLSAKGQDLKVTYALTNESGEPLRFRFASEWAFHLLAPNAPDRYYESNGQKLAHPAMNSSGTITLPLPRGGERLNIRLVDEYLKLAIGIEPDGADEIVRYPIETVSMSEGGFERIFQGSIIMPIWNVELLPGAEWDAALTVNFELIP